MSGKLDLSAISRRVEERLKAHEDLLNKQKERYESHKALLSDHQRETPSFRNTDGTEIGAPPPVTKHEELYQEGAALEIRKDELREKALQEERAKMRSAPEVSAPAKNLVRSEPLLQRFTKQEFERRQALAMEKDRLTKEAMSHGFQPQISEFAKNVPRTSQEEWDQSRKERIEEQRAKLAAENISELREKPQIIPKSVELATKKDLREGLEGLPRHEQLIERDRLSKWAQWERQYMGTGVDPSPKITSKAAMLQRDDDVSNRLYEESYFVMSRKREEYERRQEEEGAECTHTPMITSFASRMQRDVPVEDALLQRERDRQARMEAVRRERFEETVQPHHPVINPVSEEIASRLPDSTRERLTRQKIIHSDPGRDCTFSPTISQKSRQLDRSGYSDTQQSSRIEIMEARDMQRKQRLKQMADERESKELEECTFRPSTLPTREEVGQGGHAVRNTVYNRVVHWQRKRQTNLRKAQQENESKILRECTFSPQVHQRAPSSSTPSSTSRTLYGGDGKAWGFNDYVKRQEEARKKRAEKEDVENSTFITGDNWKNEATVVQEFRLGNNRTCALKSLNKPASPPTHRTSAKTYDEGTLLSMGTLETQSPLSKVTVSTTPGAFSNRLASSILSSDTNPILRRALQTLTKQEYITEEE